MSRRPNASQMLALKAAAAVAAQDEADAAPVPTPEPEVQSSPAAALEPVVKATGRPKGRRPVAARQTVYLDDARHAALARLAEDRGRSIHSLIIEGIDYVIGKPARAGWQ